MRNMMRSYITALLLIINQNIIKNDIVENLFLKLHSKNECSLEEIVCFDKSFKEIIKSSNNFAIISNHQGRNQITDSTNEFYLLTEQNGLDLSKFIKNEKELTKLEVKQKGLVGYIKFKDSDNRNYDLDFFIKNIRLQNGSFIIEDDGNKLKIRNTKYQRLISIPSRISLLDDSNHIIDQVFINKKTKRPDFFLHSSYLKKEEISDSDIVSITSSYLGKNGNYFEINDIDLVCMDLISSVLYSSGIDIEKTSLNNKKVNPYDTRRINKYLEFFMGKKELKNTISKNKNYKEFELTPELFNLDCFKPGQVIIFNRYYAEGKREDKLQKENVHIAIITKVNESGRFIEKSAMVTGAGKKLENNRYEHYGVTEMNFEEYYFRLQEYISDETKEKLYYRIHKIQDLTNAINIMKKSGYNYTDVE